MFSASLNKLVIAQAARLNWRLGDNAPSDYATLARRGLSDLEIFPGASDSSIYSEPSVNHAFRAWHDATHIIHGLGFTPADELRVAAIQCAAVACPFDRALVWADVAGQLEYYQQFGDFPIDQRAFVADYARTGIIHRHF